MGFLLSCHVPYSLTTIINGLRNPDFRLSDLPGQLYNDHLSHMKFCRAISSQAWLHPRVEFIHFLYSLTECLVF